MVSASRFQPVHGVVKRMTTFLPHFHVVWAGKPGNQPDIRIQKIPGICYSEYTCNQYIADVTVKIEDEGTESEQQNVLTASNLGRCAKSEGTSDDMRSKHQSTRGSGSSEIFVGPRLFGHPVLVLLFNVPATVTSCDLAEFFKNYGVHKARVHFDEQGKPLGSAHLLMHKVHADNLVQEFNEFHWDGQVIRFSVEEFGSEPYLDYVHDVSHVVWEARRRLTPHEEIPEHDAEFEAYFAKRE